MPKQSDVVVTPDLEAVLDALPADAPRSRLEPFRVFILRWRRAGRSYRRILQILENECGVQVSYETLRRFVQRRSRPRRQEAEPEVEISAKPESKQPASDDKWAAARQRIRQVKATPAAVEPEKLFEFSEEDATRPYVFKKE